MFEFYDPNNYSFESDMFNFPDVLLGDTVSIQDLLPSPSVCYGTQPDQASNSFFTSNLEDELTNIMSFLDQVPQQRETDIPLHHETASINAPPQRSISISKHSNVQAYTEYTAIHPIRQPALWQPSVLCSPITLLPQCTRMNAVREAKSQMSCLQPR